MPTSPVSVGISFDRDHSQALSTNKVLHAWKIMTLFLHQPINISARRTALLIEDRKSVV